MNRDRVRPFTPDDIPRVADLRRRLFCSTVHQVLPEAEAYFDLVFFGNPWYDPDLPSLVYEEAGGTITGFLGRIPRPMRFRGESIRLAVSSQFMAERGPASVRLLSRFLDGPQDLSFVDAANEASRQVWEALGGTTAVPYSLYWQRPLRPVRNALARLGDHPVVRAARFVARPPTHAADAILNAHTPFAPPDDLTGSPLEVGELVSLLPAMTRHRALVPAYTEASVQWLLDRLTARSGPGAVRGTMARDRDGKPIGWYLYERRGLVGEIVQIATSTSRWGDLLRLALADGHAQGLIAMAGRLEPRHLPELATLDVSFTRRGPWSLVHARRPDLALAVTGGDAFLSRLDAEWWVNF